MEADKSRAAAHYHAQAALIPILLGEPNGNDDSAIAQARNAFMSRLSAGTDWQMPAYPGKRYPISDFLNEADKCGQTLLFAACSAAAAGRDPREVADKLLSFVAYVASRYAADFEDQWGDE